MLYASLIYCLNSSAIIVHDHIIETMPPFFLSYMKRDNLKKKMVICLSLIFWQLNFENFKDE